MIRKLIIIEGNLPKKIENLVISWAELYIDDLWENWKLAESEKPLKPILPLMK